MEKKLPLLIYDSDCILCTRFKQTIERLDVNKLIHYASIHDEWIYDDYKTLNKEDCQKVVHFIDEAGVITKGSEVIISLMKHYPMVSSLTWMLETDVGKKALDFFYQKVNDIRNSMVEEKCNKCDKE